MSNEVQLKTIVENGGSALIGSPITISQTIYPSSGASLRFSGSGKIIHPNHVRGRTIQINESNVTLINLQIEGTNECVYENTLPYNPASIGELYSVYDTTRESDHGVGVYNADRLRILGGKISKVWGDAVYFRGSNDSRIENLTVRCAGRSGIVAVGVTDLSIVGGKISGTYWWAFNFEPYENFEVRNVTATGISVGFSRWPWLHVGGGEGGNGQVYNINVSQVNLLPESTRPSQISNDVQSSQIKRPSNDFN